MACPQLDRRLRHLCAQLQGACGHVRCSTHALPAVAAGMSDASDQTARARMPEAGSEVPVPLELTLRTLHKLNPVGAVPSGRTMQPMQPIYILVYSV